MVFANFHFKRALNTQPGAFISKESPANLSCHTGQNTANPMDGEANSATLQQPCRKLSQPETLLYVSHIPPSRYFRTMQMADPRPQEKTDSVLYSCLPPSSFHGQKLLIGCILRIGSSSIYGGIPSQNSLPKRAVRLTQQLPPYQRVPRRVNHRVTNI